MLDADCLQNKFLVKVSVLPAGIKKEQSLSAKRKGTAETYLPIKPMSPAAAGRRGLEVQEGTASSKRQIVSKWPP